MEDEKTIPVTEDPPAEEAKAEDLPIDEPPPAAPVKKKRAAPRKKAAPKKKGVTWPPTTAAAAPLAPAVPKPSRKSSPPKPLRASLYRKIAAVFIGLTVVVIGFVLYLTLSRATIRVTLKAQPVSTEALATVTPTPSGANDVLGKAVEVSLERTENVVLAGDGKPVAEKASGTVTIINTTSRAQPLVKTTRILSEGGVLFRITDGVTVPANGRVSVRAAADQPGKQGEIPASKFTIPGLAANLQDKIYAVSTEPMTGGERIVKVVTQADVDAAYKIVEDKLRAAAEGKLREAAGGAATGATAVAELTVTKRTTDAKIGAEASGVNVTVAIKATGVFYHASQLMEKLKAELAASMSGDRELVASADAPTIVIERVDAAAGTASISAKLSGSARLKSSSQAFDKEKLAGLSRADAIAYLNGFPEVESATITFRPSFLRSIPRLKDHIDIIIE